MGAVSIYEADSRIHIEKYSNSTDDILSSCEVGTRSTMKNVTTLLMIFEVFVKWLRVAYKKYHYSTNDIRSINYFYDTVYCWSQS